MRLIDKPQPVKHHSLPEEGGHRWRAAQAPEVQMCRRMARPEKPSRRASSLELQKG